MADATDLPASLEALELLGRALERLEGHPDIASKLKVVELRFFAGLTVEETAEVLGTSPATVKRDWELVRSRLEREIKQLAPED
jgi:DNA-directed RNA polymerase specialized sigma24 family protein